MKSINHINLAILMIYELSTDYSITPIPLFPEEDN